MKISVRRFSIAAALVIAAGGAGANYAHMPLSEDAGTDTSAEGLHLVLNVAGNQLHVYEDGKRTATYRVSVGMRGYETPAGEYRIRDVIWNPWWHPPNSEWARGRKIEAPGPDNPMGRVKLNFAPLLYIHGTPETHALGDPASRGCVRMRNEDVIALTKLVHSYANPKLDDKLLGRLVESPTMTRTIRLDRPIRFSAHYNVATIDNGFLIIYPDIYNLVKKDFRNQIELALQEHGVDLKQVNREHLDRLVEKGGSRRVAMSLDSLMTTRTGTSERQH